MKIPVSFGSILMDSQNEPGKLKLTTIKIFGTPTMTFPDSGAFSDVIFAKLCERMYLRLHETRRRIVMVDSKEVVVVEKALLVPIIVGPITAEMNFPVICTSSYELIIRPSSMKKMRGKIDFDKDIKTIRHKEGLSRKPLVTEGTKEGLLLRHEFTTDDKSNDANDNVVTTNGKDKEDESSQQLVLTLTEQGEACSK